MSAKTGKSSNKPTSTNIEVHLGRQDKRPGMAVLFALAALGFSTLLMILMILYFFIS